MRKNVEYLLLLTFISTSCLMMEPLNPMLEEYNKKVEYKIINGYPKYTYDSIVLKFSIKFDKRYFNYDGIIELTPVLICPLKGDSIKFEKIKFIGSQVNRLMVSENTSVVPRKNEYKVLYEDTKQWNMCNTFKVIIKPKTGFVTGKYIYNLPKEVIYLKGR